MSLLNKKNIIPCLLLTTGVLVSIFYFTVVTHWVEGYFNQTSPKWFNSFIESVYPRLSTEKHRLPAAFFIEKANQVVIRFLIINTAISLFIWWFNVRLNFRDKVKSFFLQTTDKKSFRLITRVYFGFMIITTLEWLTDFRLMSHATAFYRPISFYKLLPFPSPFVAYTFIVLMWCTALCTIFNYKVKQTGTIAFTLFTLLQGYFYCFEKIDHGYTTYTYAGMGLMISFWYSKSIGIRVSQLAIVICYVLAGLEKLLVSHFTWLDGHTLKAYLNIHPTPLGQILTENTLLMTIIPFSVICFQLGFPLVFTKRFKPWILVAGALFHWGTVALMDIGSYFHPWVVVYVFFTLRPKHDPQHQSDKQQ